MPIFRVKSVKIYTEQFFLHKHHLWCLWQIWGMLTNKIRSDSFSFSLNTRKEEKKHANNKKVEKVTGSSIFLLSAITTNILPLSEPVFSHKNNFFCAICWCLYVCCCCCCCCNFQTLANDCDLCLNNLFPTFGNKLLKF